MQYAKVHQNEIMEINEEEIKLEYIPYCIEEEVQSTGDLTIKNWLGFNGQ